jgi:hypothetical protein
LVDIMNQAARSQVENRLSEAIAAYHESATDRGGAALRRGTRTVRQWVAALRAIGSGANADMRTAPLPRERLLRIVEDPASPEEERAAAAVALATEQDDDGHARMRIVAMHVAAPRLRVAIEAAAKADDAELEAALAQVVDEGESRRAERTA